MAQISGQVMRTLLVWAKGMARQSIVHDIEESSGDFRRLGPQSLERDDGGRDASSDSQHPCRFLTRQDCTIDERQDCLGATDNGRPPGCAWLVSAGHD